MAYVAGYIAYNYDDKYKDTTGHKYHIRVFLDCDGKPIKVKGTIWGSSVHADHSDGGAWAYPDYYCSVYPRDHNAPEIFIDTRNLQALLMGCCPPLINIEQSLGMGGPT